MIPRWQSFRSIFAERAPKNIVSCSFDHEPNRIELVTVLRYGHENGASCFHMKNSMMAKTSSSCYSRKHTLVLLEHFQCHCAFIKLTKGALVAKWLGFYIITPIILFIPDGNRISGSLIATGETT
jgi:hypothetical protein